MHKFYFQLDQFSTLSERSSRLFDKLLAPYLWKDYFDNFGKRVTLHTVSDI